MNFTYNQNNIALYDESNKLLAEVAFPSVDADTVEINHTFVDESLRGQGIAGKLMLAMAETLQTRHLKAVLTCSYAQKWFGSHPEYKDLIK